MPKSLQYGKVSRQLGPCGLPRPAQLERENRSEQRRDLGKMQGPRCPRVSKSTAASLTQPLLHSRGCFPSAQPHHSPQLPASSAAEAAAHHRMQAQSRKGGETVTGERQMGLAAEMQEATLPGYLPISLGCRAPSNPFLKPEGLYLKTGLSVESRHLFLPAI